MVTQFGGVAYFFTKCVYLCPQFLELRSGNMGNFWSGRIVSVILMWLLLTLAGSRIGAG